MRYAIVAVIGCIFWAPLFFCASAEAQVSQPDQVANRSVETPGSEFRTGAWLKEVVSNLPEGVPANAVEVRSNTRLLLAEGTGPEEIDLGILQTGICFFTEIEFVNMLDREVTITDIKSSCGCLAAAHGQKLIKPKASSTMLAILAPQAKAGKFGKSLSIMTDAGATLQFLIKAEFKTQYEISPSRISVAPRPQSVTLRLRSVFPQENDDHQVVVESLTGYLKVSECKPVSFGEWEVECDIAEEARRSVRALIEQLAVRDKASGAVVNEIEVTLENNGRIGCSPDRIRLIAKDDFYVGRVLLFGDLSEIDWTQGPRVCISGIDLNEDGLSTEIAFRSSTMARLNFKIPKAATQSLKVRVASATVSIDRDHVSQIDSILFPED